MEQLYKLTKTGAVQTYLVSSNGPIITVQQGQVNGKLQTYTTTCHPVNVGKSNETTAEQQAILEAQSKWNKKVKSGYSTNPSGELTVKLPMKVKVYQDNLKNIVFPAYTSPKLDGVNGTFRLEDGLVNLYSRGGELFPAIPHLLQPIHDILTQFQLTELNVELFIPHTFLQDITGAVKKSKPLSSKLEAHIFDIPSLPGTYETRLATIIKIPTSTYVKVVPVKTALSHDDIESDYNIVMSQHYEGLVIRNPTGLYKHNQRSSDVFKYKKAMSTEVFITDYNLDKNSHPVFIVKTSTKATTTFKVKPKGTNEQRLVIVTNIQSYLNQWYTIEFESYSKSYTPTKPVGIALRDCTTTGEPLI